MYTHTPYWITQDNMANKSICTRISKAVTRKYQWSVIITMKHTRQAENAGNKLVFFLVLMFCWQTQGGCCWGKWHYAQAKEMREPGTRQGFKWEYVLINTLGSTYKISWLIKLLGTKYFHMVGPSKKNKITQTFFQIMELEKVH